VSLRAWAGRYLVAAATFLVLDLLWLGVVAARLYEDLLGDLLAEQPNALAATAFYALFLVGLLHFVVDPALARGSVARAARDGALFGLVTYATWDLTSLAVLADFPPALVPVDLAWGALLSAAVATVTTAVSRRVPALGGPAAQPTRP
jgi:uncharacterized membrane protein